MRVIRTCATALLTLIVLAACTSTTAQPGYICTDESGNPIRCTKESQDAQRAAKLETEAREVYQRFWNEYMRLARAGGTLEATDELRATAMDRTLEDIVDILAHHYNSGTKVVKMRDQLTMRVSQDHAVPGSIVALIGCEDTTDSLFVNSKGETVGTGTKSEKIRYFKRSQGQLKIFATEQGAKRCTE